MMTDKERNRIYKYKNSEGLGRLWYWVVIALTMGDVETAVAEYDKEQQVNPEEAVKQFATTQKEAEGYRRAAENRRYRGRGPYPYGRGKLRPNRKNVHTTVEVDEREEQEEIDVLTAAILASHMNEVSQHGQLDGTPTETPSNEWGGFGGGGDFSGGGAGGSWEDNSTVQASAGGSIDLGSDSY